MEIRVHSAKDAMNYIIPKVVALCDDFTNELTCSENRTKLSPWILRQQRTNSEMDL